MAVFRPDYFLPCAKCDDGVNQPVDTAGSGWKLCERHFWELQADNDFEYAAKEEARIADAKEGFPDELSS